MDGGELAKANNIEYCAGGRAGEEGRCTDLGRWSARMRGARFLIHRNRAYPASSVVIPVPSCV